MATLLPALGASGKWKLKAPFDTQLQGDLAYRCESIRYLSEVVASGFDAFNEIYVPNGISQATYDGHVADGIAIITLVSTTGSPLIIPSPYLDGWPSSNVVPYAVIGAVVTLGALPNTLDPSFLTPKIVNAIKAALGHVPEVQYVALSEVTNVEFSQHQNLENLRQANIVDDNSDYVRRLKAEADLIKANDTIAKLQQFIIDSGIPIPIVPGP